MTALRIGLFALGLALGLLPSAGRAVDLGLDPYIEYDVGVTFMRNQNLTRANPPLGGLSGRVESEPGYNVGGAIGVGFLEHFRTEVNVGYRENKADKIHLVENGPADGKGSLSMVHVLFNAYAEYDFDIGVIPYFGIGAGYGLVQLDAENDARTFQVDDEDNAFLWNVMGGVSVPFSDVTTFSLGYRYLGTEDLNLRGRIAGVGGRQVDTEYDAHELVLGIRYSFN